MTQFSREQIAEAKANPGGYVYQIDWQYRDDQHVPREAIAGAWIVDDAGNLTGEFSENSNYRAVRHASRSPQEYILRIERNSPWHDVWVLEIDPEHHSDFPDVPDEWIVGSWYFGSDGRLTGQFRPNSKYIGQLET